MAHTQPWWQRIQTLQHQLYKLREQALRQNDHEVAEQCKQLLRESERLFKERATSWIVEAEQLLEDGVPVNAGGTAQDRIS